MSKVTAQAIGIRLDGKMQNKVKTISREENLDRSMAIRLLLEEGYDSYAKKKSSTRIRVGKNNNQQGGRKSKLHDVGNREIFGNSRPQITVLY